MKKTILLATAALAFAAFPANADTYAIDPGHTFVIFKARHMGVSNAYGRFNKMSGSISVPDPKDATTAKLNIKIDAASVDTNSKKRDAHLRSADYFNVNTFPDITFVSSGVKPIAGKKDKYTITGKLTCHGITKSISAEFEFFGTGKHLGTGKDIAGAEATFSFKRSEFGMTKHLPKGVADDIHIIISIEGIKQ